MLDALAAPGMQPFTFALFALIGLMLLEVALMLVGLSSDLGLGAEAPDLAGADLADLPALPEAALAELDLTQDTGLADPGQALDAAQPAADGGLAAVLRGLGLGDAPAMVWLAALAAGFAIAGFTLQGAAQALTGSALPAALAALVAFAPALFAARSFSRLIGRLLPSVESYGSSSFHRRQGVVTVGVARAGYPAEVRYLDGYGTSHQLMAEPLDAKETIPSGSEVVILRDRQGRPRLVRLG